MAGDSPIEGGDVDEVRSREALDRGPRLQHTPQGVATSLADHREVLRRIVQADPMRLNPRAIQQVAEALLAFDAVYGPSLDNPERLGAPLRPILLSHVKLLRQIDKEPRGRALPPRLKEATGLDAGPFWRAVGDLTLSGWLVRDADGLIALTPAGRSGLVNLGDGT
jgi:hypothetical protein